MNHPLIDHAVVKHAFTTHTIPLRSMSGTVPMSRPPAIGDLVLAEVLTLGHHRRIEQRTGLMAHIFPGDLIIGAFGNRYATDQYEGYVPTEPVEECDILSVGGVLGQVMSRHPSMDAPTRLRIHGAVCDKQGHALNLRPFGLPPGEVEGRVILVIGSSMNAGKTTTAGTLARALKRGGFRSAAAKITGTAAGKDARYFSSCGAKPVLDFTDAGYPSTYMLSLEELLGIHGALVSHVGRHHPDYIIVEVADGIFQRETRMLLECEEFRRGISHVFFAANDSLSADCGVRWLARHNLPLRATCGAFTQSTLAMREAEAATGLRCLNLDQMLEGGVLEVMGLQPALAHQGNGAPAKPLRPLPPVVPTSNGVSALTPALAANPA